MPSAEAAPSHPSPPAHPPQPADTAIDVKRIARAEARLRRAAAHAASPDGAAGVRDAALAGLPVPPGAVVSGYWPLGDELDPRPLMLALAERGARLALPVVEARGLPLGFRAWRPDDEVRPGSFGIPEPRPEAGEVSPRVVLVPMLAFDPSGHRLGYGGGFYDRTLASLRARGRILAVGLAYAGQEVARVPVGPHDQPLDWVVTEVAAMEMDSPR